MKGLPCPCPALPHFWQPGSRFMAEDSGTQALGKGPSLSIQLLRAQYEGLKQRQRAQSHVVLFPKGGNVPALAPAQPRISTVWINKERRSSLSLEEAEPEAKGMPETADQDCLQTHKSPWHTHLEMHCLVQTFCEETSNQARHKDRITGSDQRLPPKGDPGLFDSNHRTQQGTEFSEAAQCQCQVANTQTKVLEEGLNSSIQCPPPTKNLHKSGKSAHYPFPQRKTPRISQTARNLGLYGPV
ncbi:PREDICTED: uncharacterized protein C9orf152 homolog [Chrysochloris asiatica]|uniref:Uncharacterized protein C9orf152 homolog n=1 Tax=Chrysochloris asiatica TaxID=185453 RepID=A0A9B0TGZ0_CHRAS|nr:PREDICTED: uncharacterized protein C9orf152 homolog [Chrysochloris asiatica]